MTIDGVAGTHFAVWAPNADRVSVVGDFNAWDGRLHPMRLHPGNGLWELFLPAVSEGARYKWNVEVLWAVDSFLRQSPPEQQREFFDAVRNGQMGLQALYGNELTGLCRPEELCVVRPRGWDGSVACRWTTISDAGLHVGRHSGDGPGGVKYWSIGPNL
jgi:hypothetical protein